MRNTFLTEVDLVSVRRPTPADHDLVEIDFEDMTPLDDPDLVGVFPLEANAVIPLPEYDLVGVRGYSAVAVKTGGGRPFDGRALGPRPEELETEEYVLERAATA